MQEFLSTVTSDRSWLDASIPPRMAAWRTAGHKAVNTSSLLMHGLRLRQIWRASRESDVINTNGMPTPDSRRTCLASGPFSLGIHTSLTITSGSNCVAALTNSSPSATAPITQNFRSKISTMQFLILVWSSATSTVRRLLLWLIFISRRIRGPSNSLSRHALSVVVPRQSTVEPGPRIGREILATRARRRKLIVARPYPQCFQEIGFEGRSLPPAVAPGYFRRAVYSYS